MCWPPFVDMINSKVSTHLWNVLNLSDGQKVAKTLSKNTIYYNYDVEQVGLSKKCQNAILPHAEICKKYAEYGYTNHLA